MQQARSRLARFAANQAVQSNSSEACWFPYAYGQISQQMQEARLQHADYRQCSSGAGPNATDIVRGAQQQSQPAQVKQNEWTPVIDKASGQVYYWNKATNETTAIGEPKPGPFGRQPARQQGSVSFGGMVGMGLGYGLIFAVIAKLLGA